MIPSFQFDFTTWSTRLLRVGFFIGPVVILATASNCSAWESGFFPTCSALRPERSLFETIRANRLQSMPLAVPVIFSGRNVFEREPILVESVRIGIGQLRPGM